MEGYVLPYTCLLVSGTLVSVFLPTIASIPK
jgi:hypothetical protein